MPKANGKYQVVLPEEGESTSLYSYIAESYESVKDYNRPGDKTIAIDEWYESPNLKFKLRKNPNASPIKFDNIRIQLVPINQAVNDIIGSLGVDFDKELPSIMIISKKGYNLNGTVRFLNLSVDELIKKRLNDQNKVDQNTIVYLKKVWTMYV